MKGELLLFTGLFLAVSCRRGPSLVGTWTRDTVVMGWPCAISTTYNEGGTFFETQSVTTGGGTIKVEFIGTWKLDGSKLQYHVDSASAVASNSTSAELSRYVLALNNDLPNQVAAENSKSPIELTWDSDDEYSIPEGNETQSYTRVVR
jgi:hypothetical protein